jgi:hypothetical protein
MPTGMAECKIREVTFDSPSDPPQMGDEVGVEVTIENTRETGVEFNYGACVVTSPQLDKPIMQACFAIATGGGTYVMDDSTGDTLPETTYDGEFPYPGEMDLNIVAGGYVGDTNCADLDVKSVEDDSKTVSLPEDMSGGGGGGGGGSDGDTSEEEIAAVAATGIAGFTVSELL